MMKNILMLIGMGLITLVFFGAFTVNESENAIVVNQANHRTYYKKSGLYFALPFLNTVNLVYMNNREAIISFTLTESGNNYVKGDSKSGDKQLVVDLLVNWHVIDSGIYLSDLQKLGQVDFNKKLVDNVLALLLQKINGNSIAIFNLLSNVTDTSINQPSLGISIDEIKIVSINYAAINSGVPMVESQSVALSDASVLDMQNKMIESAYYRAQNIKTEAQINQANKYDKIKKENPKFYNYFRLIDVYKTSAKDKLDVPSFDKLYH